MYSAWGMGAWRPKAAATKFMVTRADLVSALTHTQLSPGARQKLERIFDSQACPTLISRHDAEEISKETRLQTARLMMELLPVAQLFSVSPISNFKVGAVARGLSGNLYFGSNMEFVGEALSFCTHGEQSATVNAWVHGEKGIDALAINYAPCGYCRQFLNELGTAARLEILLPDKPAIPLSQLLPEAFGPQNLNVNGGLMQTQGETLVLETESKDPAVLVALAAANLSYAPYSKSRAGVALATRSGEIYTGPYAENAAYNPSISPMESALAHLTMCLGAFDDISRAVLVQQRSKLCLQIDASRAVLKSVSQVPLEIHFAREQRQS